MAKQINFILLTLVFYFSICLGKSFLLNNFCTTSYEGQRSTIPRCYLTLLNFQFFSFSGVHSLQIVTKNHENLEIQKGEEMILVCTADIEARDCVFKGPKSQYYSMIKGAK